MLITPVKVVFKQLEDALMQITNEQYALALPVFSGASIGGHSRHLVELFNELLSGYESGIINYENRQRDKVLENDKDALISALHKISALLNRRDKPLLLMADYDYNETAVVNCCSSYHRELAHVLDHAVHHLALIKIGLLHVQPNINLPAEFGVAAATIKSNRQCAQ